MRCDLGGTDIHYEIHGDGRPVVFLHGWPMDLQVEAADYEPIFARRAGWRRIYFDLPGMGRSRASNDIRDQDGVLTAVLSFLDAVLPGERFALSGTSLGAHLALGVLNDRAERIDGVLLRMPCVVPQDALRDRPSFHPLIADPALMAALSPDEKAELGEVLVQREAYVAAQLRKARSLIQPAMQAAAPISADIRADPARYALSAEVAPPKRPFENPALVMAGRQDTVVGYRDALKLLDSFPRGTFAVIDRADHGWPIDHKGLFSALVEDWLDRMEDRPSCQTAALTPAPAARSGETAGAP